MLLGGLIILGIIRSFFIKHTVENQYMTLVKNSKFTIVKLTNKLERAADFTIARHINGLIFIKDVFDNDKVFDIEGMTNLILYGFHGGPNQQFSLSMVAPGKFLIMNMAMCIEYTPRLGSFSLRPCDNTDNQLFEVIDPVRVLTHPDPTGHNYMKHGIINSEIINAHSLHQALAHHYGHKHAKYRYKIPHS
ncbi:hypothetical protein NBO_463g0006 [Nosema bombycis CQ1]|uniref:Ricin B lectin n=1 Tax=Nosema bombycis (strain CQ1 / CVCC 102059) TaxID=578461 RepID=R0KQ45_NOSB1|nr:hypothetical protein NBO_463g0006 [Nosema bombycis CQ1]WGJ64404.1 ricin B lectin-like protein [Nosema bombycis]|eukprot:EOB12327.1 hypothetical protein NBO_463g0006 [Nosema bombycis CQ1]